MSKEKKRRDEESEFSRLFLDPSGTVRIIDNAEVVIQSYFSNIIFNQILQLSNSFEIALATAGLLLLYMVLDKPIRKFVVRKILAKDNPPLVRAIEGFMDYIFYIGLFLLTQFMLQLIVIGFDEGFLSIAETIVTIFSVLLIFYAIIATLKELQIARIRRKVGDRTETLEYSIYQSSVN
jgi:hypothetical protein